MCEWKILSKGPVTDCKVIAFVQSQRKSTKQAAQQWSMLWSSVQILHSHFIFWRHKYQFLPNVTGQYGEGCYILSCNVLSNIDVDRLFTGIPCTDLEGKVPNDVCRLFGK